MTSIASTTVSSLFTDRSRQTGGKNPIADRISQAAESGTISSTDATALTSALGAIDESLSASRSTSTSTRRDPGAMKEKIDGLIADQVSAGTLTSDQADELKSLFAKGGSKDGHGHGGPGGAGGPSPSPSTSADATDGASSSNDTSALLVDFLKQLQASTNSQTGYSSNGATSTTNAASSLVLDFDT